MTGPGFTDMEPGSKPAGHARPVCGAKLRQPLEHRTSCVRPAGWGTNHKGVGACSYHGGSTPSHERHGQEQLARAQAVKLGVPVVTTGAAAVEHALALAHGQMLVAGRIVADLPAERLTVLDKAGTTRTAGEVVFFQEALREYARQAKDVVDMGLDARRVAVAERMFEAVLLAVQRVLDDRRQVLEARLGHALPELEGTVVGPLMHQMLTEVGAEITEGESGA